jgi:hypothetical protein
MAWLGSLLQRTGTRPVASLALDAPTLEVRLDPGLVYSLRDVAGTFTMQGRSPEIQASYRLADAPGAPRCELTLRRDRATSTPRTTLTFRNAERTRLPAGVLEPYFDAAAWLGSAASIDGELTLEQSGADDWEARFHGTIDDLDLASLVRQVAPEQRLSGRARLTVEAFHWGPRPGRGPGWRQARGLLAVPDGGSVGSDLLRNLASQLRFRVPERALSSRVDVEYSGLGLAFDLTPGGEIRLIGGLGPEHGPGAVMVQARRPEEALALAPEGLATVAGLIWSLAPSQDRNPQQSIPTGFHSILIQQALPSSSRAN